MHVIPPGGKDRPAPAAVGHVAGGSARPTATPPGPDRPAAIASRLPERILDDWEREWRPAFANEIR